MSDHEDTCDVREYGAPVPELDDHRRRPRRGTFDSTHARRLDVDTQPDVGLGGSRGEQTLSPTIRVRDFEEAVDDDEGGDVSPHPHVGRPRRPTVETMDVRSVSPPNSVKAFAEARRRERQMSFTEYRPDRREEPSTHRAMSVSSRRSRYSRPHTAADPDSASVVPDSAAEDDVCFPQDTPQDERLEIDFDILEDFMEGRRSLSGDSETFQVFPDMRPGSRQSAPVQVVTSDGDVLTMPYTTSPQQDEKASIREHKATPGQVPQHVESNRFDYFSSNMASTIHAAELGDLVLPGEDIRSLFEIQSNGVFWLNTTNPTKDEVRAICRAFGVHPLTIEDINQKESREKIELFQSYYFACFRSFETVPEAEGQVEYEPYNIYVVCFREGILSFSWTPNSHAANVRNRIIKLKDHMDLSSDWICYAIIDDIVDSFGPIIHQLEHESDSIEDEVFIARTEDMQQFIRKIGFTRRNVMSLMRLLGGKADVLRGFTKRCNENYKMTPHMEVGLYLGDIQDHVVTMMNNLGHFEKMLSRSHTNYLAQIQIDGITQGTATNRTLSKITFLASIIVPLNVITGLFGMNVKVPFQAEDDDNNLAPFFVILAVLVSFCAILIMLARRLRFI